MSANPTPSDQRTEHLYTRIKKVLSDLEFLKRENQERPDSRIESKFRERAPQLQLHELEKKHQKGLEDKADSFGLPLTIDEYKEWRSLYDTNTTSKGTESYRRKATELESYEKLKGIHDLHAGNIKTADEEIENLLKQLTTRDPADRLVIEQPDILSDGVLAYLEREAIDFMAIQAQFARHKAALEKMGECLKHLSVNTVLWNARMRILTAWSQGKTVEMWDEIAQLKHIVQITPASADAINNGTGWEAFRLAQTKDDQPGGNGFLAKCLPALVTKLDRAISDAQLALGATQPSSERMTAGLQAILILREVKNSNSAFVQDISFNAAEIVFKRLVSRLPDILEHLRAQLEQEVIARLPQLPLQDLLIILKSLVSGVKRVRDGVNVEDNSTSSAELKTLEDKVETARSKLERLEKYYLEMFTVLRQILVADPAVIGGQTTWNFVLFDVPKGSADLVIKEFEKEFPEATEHFTTVGQGFDCQSVRILAEQKDSIEKLIGGSDKNTRSIALSIKHIQDYLSPKERTQSTPLERYKTARQELDNIDALVNSVNDQLRTIFGETTEFRIPRQFMISPVEIKIEGRFIKVCEGLDEHKSLVNKLIKRATEWDEWCTKVIKAYSDMTNDKHYEAICAWNKYALALPISPWQRLDQDSFGWVERVIKPPESDAKTTREIIRHLREENGSPNRAFVIVKNTLPSDGVNEEKDVYELYECGKRLQGALDIAKSPPSESMPDDIAQYLERAEGDKSLLISIGIEPRTDFSILKIAEHVENKVNEIFHECCKADYIAHRFCGYVDALENNVKGLKNYPPPWYSLIERNNHRDGIASLEKQIALLENRS